MSGFGAEPGCMVECQRLFPGENYSKRGKHRMEVTEGGLGCVGSRHLVNGPFVGGG